jgi:hypothetical protein
MEPIPRLRATTVRVKDGVVLEEHRYLIVTLCTELTRTANPTAIADGKDHCRHFDKRFLLHKNDLNSRTVSETTDSSNKIVIFHAS